MDDVYTLEESTRGGLVTRNESGLDERTAWKWYEWSDASVVKLYKNGELIASKEI